MSKSLDTILEQIDPARTVDETERRATDAFISFSVPKVRLDTFAEFQGTVSRFVRQVENAILGSSASFPVNEKMDFYHAHRLLKKKYGNDGEKVACNMAMRGVDGGLNRVLRVLLDQLVAEYSLREIESRIGVWWNGLSIKEKLAVSDEYVAKYGYLWPADVVDGGAPRLRAYFPKFLAKHPLLTRNMRQTIR